MENENGRININMKDYNSQNSRDKSKEILKQALEVQKILRNEISEPRPKTKESNKITPIVIDLENQKGKNKNDPLLNSNKKCREIRKKENEQNFQKIEQKVQNAMRINENNLVTLLNLKTKSRTTSNKNSLVCKIKITSTLQQSKESPKKMKQQASKIKESPIKRINKHSEKIDLSNKKSNNAKKVYNNMKNVKELKEITYCDLAIKLSEEITTKACHHRKAEFRRSIGPIQNINNGFFGK